MERDERLAVSLTDLDKVDPTTRDNLLTGKLSTAKVVVEGDTCEAALMLTCDLLVAASALDILRNHDRKCGETPTRVYIRRGKTWSRLSSVTMLTVVQFGTVLLNPAIFPPKIELGSAPPVKTLKLGTKICR